MCTALLHLTRNLIILLGCSNSFLIRTSFGTALVHSVVLIMAFVQKPYDVYKYSDDYIYSEEAKFYFLISK